MEIRNIKISLEKAKEWYQKGGELKELVLQAFKEKELTSVRFPKSWDEYNRNARCKDSRVNAGYIINSICYCHFATKEEAEAFVALGKLIQLRDKYWELDDNWKPDWKCSDKKFCIGVYYGKIFKETWITKKHLLCFSSEKLLDIFYKNFMDLIEVAKMFL